MLAILGVVIFSRLSPTRVIARLFAIGTGLLLPISAMSLMREGWRTIPRTAWIGLALVIAGPTIVAALFLREQIRPIVILAAIMIFVGVCVTGEQQLRRQHTVGPSP